MADGPTSEESTRPAKRFRARAHYFLVNDLVWVRPAKLPYWPAEVIESDEPRNRVRARLLCPPAAALLEANLQSERQSWARAQRRRVEAQAAEQVADDKAHPSPAAASDSGGGEGDGRPPAHAGTAVEPAPAQVEADVVTASGSSVYFFDKLATVEELQACVEERLNRARHDVSAYEADFLRATMRANALVRTVLSPERLQPYEVCGIGVVHSLMRHHIAAPRQPGTDTFEPQTALIRLRAGLENALRDLAGFEYIWVLFQFSYAAALATGEGQAYLRRAQAAGSGAEADANAPASDLPPALPWAARQGVARSRGFKTLLVPPRDEELRGVFATRSPHRPNFIGLSCVRLVRVQGLDVHIADHDLLHGTPVLDIKPYLPFCDAHPDARAGWVEELDRSGKGKGDHKVAEQQRQIDRVFAAPSDGGDEQM